MKRFFVALSMLLLWTTVLIPVPVRETSLTSDPAEYVASMIENYLPVRLNEFYFNGIKFSYLQTITDKREEAKRLIRLIRGVEKKDSEIKFRSFIKKSRKKKKIPVPLFTLPVVTEDKNVEFRLDFAVPVSRAASPEEVRKYLSDLYAKEVMGLSDLVALVEMAYCNGWITSDQIAETLVPPFKIAGLLKLDLSPLYRKMFPFLYDEKRKDEFCYSDYLERAIETLKPVAGFSVNILSKKKGNWHISALIAHNLIFEKFLPLMRPGKYYLSVTVPTLGGCGEVLTVIDYKGFKMKLKKRKLTGRFNLALSDIPSDQLMECAAEKYREKGWIEFSPSEVTRAVSRNFNMAGEKLAPYLERSDLFLPVISGGDFSVKESVEDAGRYIRDIVDHLGEMERSLTQSIRFLFSSGGKDEGMVVLAGGSMEVRLDKRDEKKFSTIMILEVK